MTINELIKEAFNTGWNAYHECADSLDYDYAFNGFMSAHESKLKNLTLPCVSGELPPHVCKYCGVETNQPDEECYKRPI